MPELDRLSRPLSVFSFPGRARLRRSDSASAFALIALLLAAFATAALAGAPKVVMVEDFTATW